MSSVMPRALAWELGCSHLKHCESAFGSNIATDSYDSIEPHPGARLGSFITPIDARKSESAGHRFGSVSAPTNTALTSIIVALFSAHPKHFLPTNISF